MNSVRLFMPGNFLDSYIYAGHLFAIFSDGTIRALDISELLASIISVRKADTILHKIAFQRNDWIENPQGRSFLAIRRVSGNFLAEWRRICKEDLIASPSEEKWKFIGKLPELKINDFRVYGMKVMVGARSGVFEVGIEARENKHILRASGDLRKVSDIPAIALNAKGGQMVVSAGNEGLLHGPIGYPNNRTPLSADEHVTTSLRTGWQGYDLVNYISQQDFSYFENETKKQEERPHLYSRTDEPSEKILIATFGRRIVSSAELIPQEYSNKDDLMLSFNSNNGFFQIRRDGRIQWFMTKRIRDGRLEIDPRERALGKIDRRGSAFRPMSAHFGRDKTVLEFFDKVRVLESGHLWTLEGGPAVSLRTFPSSRRFRNLVLITSEKGIIIHSLSPRTP